MAKINYYLQHPQKEKSLLYVSMYASDGRVQISTGESVVTKYWNDRSKRANTKGYVDGNGINSVLDLIETDLKEKINVLKATKLLLTKETIKEVVAKTTSRTCSVKSEDRNFSFWNYFEQFLNTERFNKEGLPLKQQSYSAYKQTYKRLKDFEKAKRIKLQFASFDKGTMEQFVAFLYKKPNNNFVENAMVGLTPNTISLTVRRLKTVLSDAADKGYLLPASYKKAKASPVETTEVALTEIELMKLYHLDLSNSRSYDIVRDLFLIGCYTALRFSDYGKVAENNITTNQNGQRFLSITTEKTNQRIIIPVLPIVENILQKYGGVLPKSYPNQVMNRYIKEIAAQAFINDLVKVTEYQSGQRVELDKKKYEMISTHTARRTGATLIYNATSDIYLCMSLTGHKSERQFQKYIRNSGMDNAIKLSQEFERKGFGTIFNPQIANLKINTKTA